MTGVDLDADLAGTGRVIAEVLTGHRDVRRALDEVHRAAWAGVQPRLLELCRLRAAQLLGADEEAGVITDGAGVTEEELARLSRWYERDSGFDSTERAVLTWCEQFVVDVASMGPEHTEAVRSALGDAALVDLTSALLVVEQRQRLRAMWTRLGLVGESAT